MNEFFKNLMLFLFGAGGLAIISIIQERWKWRADRKAKKEDRAAEEEDKLDEISKQLGDFIEKQEEFNAKTTDRLKEMEANDKAQQEGIKYVLLDRIIYIGQSFINHGEVTYDERKRLGDMHAVYHEKLGGNGDADSVMKDVYELPLKSGK